MALTALVLTELPTEVLAAVLGRYSRGRTISTFLWVSLGHRSLRRSAFSLCRGALVQRYVELRNHPKLAADSHGEVCDVLDVVREDVRLSQDDDEGIMTKFSEWCAILDYFEMQMEATACFRCPQWIVWCGELEVPYGRIHSYLTTSTWTVCALQYWRNQELTQWTMTRPRHSDFSFIAEDREPYGTLFGLRQMDRYLLGRQCSDLEVHVLSDMTDTNRYCLVSLSEAYDELPSIVFVDHGLICRTHAALLPFVTPLIVDPELQSLCCCWDTEIGEDLWDDAILNFGQNAIRIMESLGHHISTETFVELHRSANEFPRAC